MNLLVVCLFSPHIFYRAMFSMLPILFIFFIFSSYILDENSNVIDECYEMMKNTAHADWENSDAGSSDRRSISRKLVMPSPGSYLALELNFFLEL